MMTSSMGWTKFLPSLRHMKKPPHVECRLGRKSLHARGMPTPRVSITLLRQSVSSPASSADLLFPQGFQRRQIWNESRLHHCHKHHSSTHHRRHPTSRMYFALEVVQGGAPDRKKIGNDSCEPFALTGLDLPYPFGNIIVSMFSQKITSVAGVHVAKQCWWNSQLSKVVCKLSLGTRLLHTRGQT